MSERITIKDRIIQLLSDMPDGLSTEDIMKTLNISKQALYSGVHDTNKKNNRHKIVNVNQKYKLTIRKTSSSNVPAVTDINNAPATKHFPSGITVTNDFVKKLKLLEEPDRTDALDMLKKAHFYKKSAEALIEANEAVMLLRTSLQM